MDVQNRPRGVNWSINRWSGAMVHWVHWLISNTPFSFNNWRGQSQVVNDPMMQYPINMRNDLYIPVISCSYSPSRFCPRALSPCVPCRSFLWSKCLAVSSSVSMARCFTKLDLVSTALYVYGSYVGFADGFRVSLKKQPVCPIGWWK